MVGFDSLVVTLPLILFGLAFAFAGRDLHHLVVSAFGFLVGFGGFMLGWGGAAVMNAWNQGAFARLIGQLILGLIIATIIGYIMIHITWVIYRLIIMFPGYVVGGFIGVSILAPLDGVVDVLLLLILAGLGGTVAWILHEALLVLNTAFLGGFLVGIGVAGEGISQLPVVQQPGRLLVEPVVVFQQSLAVGQTFVTTVVVIFILGSLSQYGILPIGFVFDWMGRLLTIGSSKLTRLGGIPSGRLKQSHETRQKTRTARTPTTPNSRKSRPPEESTVPSESPDDSSGFYNKD